jgi:hypothetical protein
MSQASSVSAEMPGWQLSAEFGFAVCWSATTVSAASAAVARSLYGTPGKRRNDTPPRAPISSRRRTPRTPPYSPRRRGSRDLAELLDEAHNVLNAGFAHTHPLARQAAT